MTAMRLPQHENAGMGSGLVALVTRGIRQAALEHMIERGTARIASVSPVIGQFPAASKSGRPGR